MYRLALTWKTVDDYNKNIASRLTKLAAAQSTGLVPITGPSSGAIYFEDGAVVYAQSSRIPSPHGVRPSWALPPEATGDRAPELAPTAQVRGIGEAHRIGEGHRIGEAIIDAALDLLTSRSACSRFRSAKADRAAPSEFSISVADLLAEVTRRQRLLRQFAGITADTDVSRTTTLDLQRVQISAPEWALLIRVRSGSTPRDLAWDLGRSVFSATAEVHRLMSLGLLSAAGGGSAGGGSATTAAGSFMRALPDQKGA